MLVSFSSFEMPYFSHVVCGLVFVENRETPHARGDGRRQVMRGTVFTLQA
jgi:hypothetical protein